jgi:hypothetical protein
MWAYGAVKVLRGSMLSSELLPPREVFRIESMPVLRREAFAKDGENIEKGNGLDRRQRGVYYIISII